MIKQTHPGLYDEIQTDGCYFMVDLSIGEDIALRIGKQHHQFTPEEINLAYDYAIPKFMHDGTEARKNRCYILDHREIVGIGLRLMGFRDFEMEYLYRKDGDQIIIGSELNLDRCNYFVKEVLVGNGPVTHFVRCDRIGVSLYNPGITDDMDWESFRGYLVKVQGGI